MALNEMAKAVRPNTTTEQIAEIGAKVLAEHGAESSPPKTYGFPGTVCISVNEEAIHGVPRSRLIEEGDLVKLDLAAEKDGFVADAAITVRVGKVSQAADYLVRCAELAFRKGAAAAYAGNRVCEIGRAVDREVRSCGFSVMRELCGH